MVEIKCRFTGKALFTHDGDSPKVAVEAAVSAGANLDGANLVGANLVGANLVGAYLVGANLVGANLDGGEVASGTRPCLQIGPIGSRSAYLVSWITRNGVFIKAGCFWGSRDAFAAEVRETHGDNEHAQEYEAALALIDAHARLWTPQEEER